MKRVRELLHELAGNPARDLFGIGSGESKDDVGEAGLDGRGDRGPGRRRLAVVGSEVDRAGDRGWIAAVLVAQLVEVRAPRDAVVDVAAGDVPYVGVRGDDT